MDLLCFIAWYRRKEIPYGHLLSSRPVQFNILLSSPETGGKGNPYNGLYEKAPPERGTFFRLQVYERVGI